MTIELQGSRYWDIKLSNEAAGITRVRAGEAPDGYVWHNLDDFDPVTGASSIQLIEKGAHKATYTHYGSVKQYEQ